MSEFRQLRDVFEGASRWGQWQSDDVIVFTPSAAGRELLERAIGKQQARGRVNYGLADAARDVLDWAAHTEVATRR